MPAPLPDPPPWLSTGLLLVVVLAAFESMAISTVLPRVASDLGGLELYGWASSAFLLASLFGSVLAGLVADRRSVARGALLSLGIFALGTLLVAAAPSMLTFVLGRAVQGLGGGGLGALPFTVIGLAYPEDQRSRMLAAVSSAWLIPSLVGPVIASTLTDLWGWRVVFWGLLPLLLLAAPLCVWPLRHLGSGEATTSRRILWPALVLTLATGLALEALRRVDTLSLVLLPLGLLGLAWSSRHLFVPGLWRLRRGLPSALVVRGLAAYALMGTDTFFPLALRELRGLTLTQGGVLLSLGGVMWTLGSWVQSLIEKRHDPAERPGRVRLAFGVMTALMALMAGAVLGYLPFWVVYPSWALACVGMGIGYNSNSLLALSHARAEEQAGLSAQLANIEVLMIALAAGISGALIATLGTGQLSFNVAFGLAVLTSGLAAALAGRGGSA